MALLPASRQLFFTDQPCQLVEVHRPRPVTSEHHHTKPEFLQQRLWGEVRFGPDLWVCPNCHDAIHAWLYWLLGEHRQPPYIGLAAKHEAERTYQWYLAEKAA
jgi:hypothetical protein